jgi:hypothetical protein
MKIFRYIGGNIPLIDPIRPVNYISGIAIEQFNSATLSFHMPAAAV